MDFESYLIEQLKIHPSIQPQDVVKMCYQAAYGAEHLLSDLTDAWNYLQKEYLSVSASDDVLFEQISDRVSRINLSAWKAKNFPLMWLFRMFASSCKINQQVSEQFAEYLQKSEQVIASGKTGFSWQEWQSYLREYIDRGMPAVHHSAQYQTGEHPAYRIVDSRFCRILPLLERVQEYQLNEKPCVIAIDGRAASGKTTLAADLQNVLDGEVIHMDDFFVPPVLRSEERFKTPGENIHHERFAEEVLPYIAKREPFSYRIFDCSIMDYNGRQEIGDKPFRIVEGSYSCHPIFGGYADITVFSDVSSDEQIERIRNRNGEEMLKMFVTRWIPMEEEYFSHYLIRDKVNITV